MSGEKVHNALARIDAALARIERIETQADAASRELVARHDRLRLAVGQSLAELDRLIEDART